MNVNDLSDAIQELYRALSDGFSGDIFHAEVGRQRRIEKFHRTLGTELCKDEKIKMVSFAKSSSGEWEIYL